MKILLNFWPLLVAATLSTAALIINYPGSALSVQPTVVPAEITSPLSLFALTTVPALPTTVSGPLQSSPLSGVYTNDQPPYEICSNKYTPPPRKNNGDDPYPVVTSPIVSYHPAGAAPTVPYSIPVITPPPRVYAGGSSPLPPITMPVVVFGSACEAVKMDVYPSPPDPLEREAGEERMMEGAEDAAKMVGDERGGGEEGGSQDRGLADARSHAAIEMGHGPVVHPVQASQAVSALDLEAYLQKEGGELQKAAETTFRTAIRERL
ncbi:hypothetical protein LTR62_004835 [Meristemomyces frigidus]|uniref:Uncharacterized protein n=1 Tax=Meristemomyces frigidus TaxID=1508187 RepID=A0AAN7TQ82_9PEZI|nr:hypothetical protein LTR62_004835 [Meristemomyces frigidus]